MYAAKKRVAVLKSTSPPIGGLNTVAPAAAMSEQFARRLVNFFPGEFSMKAREGYTEWSTGLGGVVETIIPYITTAGVVQQFGATNGGLYETTVKGAVGAVVHALTEGRCSYVQITNLAGSYLVVCNGGDATFMYDGTAFVTWTEVVTPAAPGEISGINPNRFIAVTTHNKRLWFIERHSLNAWYLPLEQVGGVMQRFPLGSVFKKGGYLKALFTMSTDSGEGLDDVLIFETDQGELAGYMGGNVEDFQEWHLSAVHYISKPRTDRGWVTTTGDVYLLCGFGVLPLQAIISSPGRSIDVKLSLSKNVYPSLREELLARGNNANWEAVLLPMRQMLLVLFPDSGRPGVQFIMNTETGAWGRYNLPMTTAALVDGDLFFGTKDGRVCRFGDVYKDNVLLDGSGGVEIIGSIAQAYSYFDQRGVNKHFNLIKLIWNTAYPPAYKVDLSCDYLENKRYELVPIPPEPIAYDLWDKGIWDGAHWPEPISTIFRWDGLGWLGYCASVLVDVRINRPLELVAIDWAFEPGQSL